MSNREFLSDRKLVVATLASGAEATSDAANYTFDPSVRMCLVSNKGTTIKFLVRANTNATAGVNEATVAIYEEVVGPGETVDICRGGARIVRNLSVFFDGTFVADTVEVWGLT
jgi:hypothetical protein